MENAKKKIIEALIPVMEEKGYKEDSEKGCFIIAEERAVRVFFDESDSQMKLQSCGYGDGNIDEEWKNLSSWYFDEESDERDVKSISNDFQDTLKEFLKIKAKKVKMSDLSAAKKGTGVDAFTARFLAIYPMYKDAYVEMNEKYGTFLADEFFTKYGREKLFEVLDSKTKKPISKFVNLLNEFYEEGTPEVRSIIGATILAGLVDYEGENESFDMLFENMSDLLSDCTRAMVKYTAKHSKKK